MSDEFDIFTEEGKLYEINPALLDKFVGEDPRRDSLWVFTIRNPFDRSAYSGPILEVEGIKFEKKYQRQIYFDSKYYFCLCIRSGDENKLVASLGFNHIGYYVRVAQLQGKRYREEELKGLRWEKLLLAICCDWAFSQSQVKIMDVKPSVQSLKERDPIGNKLKYEVTPHRLGFRKHTSGNMQIYRTTWLERARLQYGIGVH